MISILKVYRFPSLEQRNLIMQMFLDDKIITFDSQTVYRNNLSFKRAMAELHEWRIVGCRHVHNGFNEYKLTLFGEHIADLIRGFSKAKA